MQLAENSTSTMSVYKDSIVMAPETRVVRERKLDNN